MSRPAHVVAGTWSPDHNPFIDGIINDTSHWQSTTVAGAPQHISVFFSNEDRTWTAAEKANFTNALNIWSAVANIDFDVVASRADANLIEVKYSDPASSELGVHEVPAIGFATAIGWFNSGTDSYNAAGSLNPGGDAYYTFVHELGHALGLDHTHDGRLFPGVTPGASGDLGDHDLNQGVFSVMSYNATYNNVPDVGADFAWGRPMGPMAFDIAAIQQLYGANTDTACGDDIYILPDANAAGTGWACIWDNAGVDQVVYNGTRDATLDLRAATLLNAPGGGGYLSSADGIAGGFTIAHGVVIENATGGRGDDQITGNDSANTLSGREGDDTLIGGDGGDRLDGGAGEDWAVYDDSGVGVLVNLATGRGFNGTADRDVLLGIEDVQGSRFGDILVGNDQANRLRGGLGGDYLDGGAGGDWAVYDRSGVGVQVNLATGHGSGGPAEGDTLVRIENVEGSQHSDILTGNAEANRFKGGGGADQIDGGGGADVLIGGDNDDWYFVDNAGDLILENATGGPLDRVFASADYTLTARAQVEVMSTTSHTGTAPIHLTGNEFANTIYGNAGDNRINGAAAADTMIGWGGNDWYFVDNAGDVVREAAAEGAVDRVFASANYTLTAGAYVEVTSTTDHPGTAPINLTGNELANSIYGNAGDNVLNGGAGLDTLTGWAGRDTFVFNSPLGPGNVDHIVDFSVAEHDKIELHRGAFPALPPEMTLPAYAFHVGTSAHDADDRIVYNDVSGELFYDADGIGGLGGVRFAVLDNHAALTNTDFMVMA